MVKVCLQFLMLVSGRKGAVATLLSHLFVAAVLLGLRTVTTLPLDYSLHQYRLGRFFRWGQVMHFYQVATQHSAS